MPIPTFIIPSPSIRSHTQFVYSCKKKSHNKHPRIYRSYIETLEQLISRHSPANNFNPSPEPLANKDASLIKPRQSQPPGIGQKESAIRRSNPLPGLNRDYSLELRKRRRTPRQRRKSRDSIDCTPWTLPMRTDRRVKQKKIPRCSSLCLRAVCLT